MKRVLFFVFIITCFIGCKTSKTAQDIVGNQQDVWETMIVKQLDCSITDNIIKVNYNNGSTLYFRILDNFGNISVTWDRSDNRKSFDDGVSNYKGEIDIPSFVTAGEHNEFVFRVQEIDQNTFCNCSEITRLRIPYSILRISMDAFKDCNKLEQITVNEFNPTYVSIDGVLFSKDKKMLILFPAKKNVKDYSLPNDVVFICPGAFKGNEFLESVTIDDNVTALSDFSFKSCTNLKTVKLGHNVRIIGRESFRNCPNILEIYSMNVFPPHNCPIVFDSSIKANCKVYIPKGQKDNYLKRLEWSEFKNYIEQ